MVRCKQTASKTMIKAIAIIVVVLAALILFGFFRSASLRSIVIERSVTVGGPLTKVYGLVQNLNEFPKWSPFLAADPGQKYEVKGTDGAVGAQFHWNGNGGKDLGYQEIVKVEPGKFVGMRCDIQKPFVAHPTFDYSFSEGPDGVKVTQVFKLESAAVDAFFMWLFGAKGEMEKMNEQGLALLKKAGEQS
jgi:hypothetical protein